MCEKTLRHNVENMMGVQGDLLIDVNMSRQLGLTATHTQVTQLPVSTPQIRPSTTLTCAAAVAAASIFPIDRHHPPSRLTTHTLKNVSNTAR